MSSKAKVEAIIYATEEPVTLNQLASLLKDTVLAELRAEEEARMGKPFPEGVAVSKSLQRIHLGANGLERQIRGERATDTPSVIRCQRLNANCDIHLRISKRQSAWRW